MARRSEHSQEQIKEMVLAAAETIVVEDGYHALTVRKIAFEIGYTVGSIYMVFANMNDLATHLKGRTLDQLALELEATVGQKPADTTILSLAQTYLGFACQHYNRWRMIFDKQSDELTPDWYQQKVEQMFGYVETQFQHLMPGVTPEQSRVAARALWSGVHGVCILALDGNQQLAQARLSAQQTIEVLVCAFIKGWQLDPACASVTPPAA